MKYNLNINSNNEFLRKTVAIEVKKMMVIMKIMLFNLNK